MAKHKINSDGTEGVETKVEKALDDRPMDSLTEFRHKIDAAKMSGDEWIETDQRMINYYVKGGLGNAGYFLFDGIKVCLHGTRDEIEAREGMTSEVRMHGAAEAGVSGLKIDTRKANGDTQQL